MTNVIGISIKPIISRHAIIDQELESITHPRLVSRLLQASSRQIRAWYTGTRRRPVFTFHATLVTCCPEITLRTDHNCCCSNTRLSLKCLDDSPTKNQRVNLTYISTRDVNNSFLSQKEIIELFMGSLESFSNYLPVQ